RTCSRELSRRTTVAPSVTSGLLRWSDVRDSSHQGSRNELDQLVDSELAVVLVLVDRGPDLTVVVSMVVGFFGVEDLAVHVLRCIGAEVGDHWRHELGSGHRHS